MKLSLNTKHSTCSTQGNVTSHQWFSEHSVVLGTQESRIRTEPWHGKITKGTLHGQGIFFTQ